MSLVEPLNRDLGMESGRASRRKEQEGTVNTDGQGPDPQSFTSCEDTEHRLKFPVP